MLRFLPLVLPTLVLMTSCTRTPPMQVVMDIPPIVRAPDLLRQLDLNVPRDLARTALREAAVTEPDFDAAPAFLAEQASGQWRRSLAQRTTDESQGGWRVR